MAIVRERVINQIEVLENGIMQIREAEWFVEDGIRVGQPTYHRRVIDVDEPIDPSEDQLIQDVANGTVRTQARVDARIAEKAAQAAAVETPAPETPVDPGTPQ